METALAQMFAERLGLSPEELAAVQAGEPAPLLSRCSDPLLAAMINSVASRKTAPRAASELPHDPAQTLERAKEVIHKLRKELASARAMLDYMGELFGACPSCMGLNRVCPDCHGQGGPGYRPPNLLEMLPWVEPALERGGLRLTREEIKPAKKDAGAAGV